MNKDELKEVFLHGETHADMSVFPYMKGDVMKIESTAKPLTVSEVFELTGGDAVYHAKDEGFSFRIMNYSACQTVYVDRVYVAEGGFKFGLRKVGRNKEYDYIGFLIK